MSQSPARGVAAHARLAHESVSSLCVSEPQDLLHALRKLRQMLETTASTKAMQQEIFAELFAKRGGVDAVSRILQTFVASGSPPEIVEHALASLVCLLHAVPKRTSKAAIGAKCDAKFLFSVVRLFAKNHLIVQSSCVALRTLADYDAGVLAATKSCNGIEVLLTAVTRHTRHSTTVQAILNSLHRLCKSSSTLDAFARSPALPGLLAAFPKAVETKTANANSILSLCALASGRNDRSRRSLSAAGVAHFAIGRLLASFEDIQTATNALSILQKVGFFATADLNRKQNSNESFDASSEGPDTKQCHPEKTRQILGIAPASQLTCEATQPEWEHPRQLMRRAFDRLYPLVGLFLGRDTLLERLCKVLWKLHPSSLHWEMNQAFEMPLESPEKSCAFIAEILGKSQNRALPTCARFRAFCSESGRLNSFLHAKLEPKSPRPTLDAALALVHALHETGGSAWKMPGSRASNLIFDWMSSKQHVSPPRELSFSCDFECGNLARVEHWGGSWYALWIRADTNSYGQLQWFYFAMKGLRPGARYNFVFMNLEKTDSLYNAGMRPLAFSPEAATRCAAGWRRIGVNISYFESPFHKTGPAATLATRSKPGATTGNATKSVIPCYAIHMEIEVPEIYRESDTVFMSYCYPYTYTNLLQDLEALCDKKHYVEQTTLCKTLGGLDCPLLTITSPPCTTREKEAGGNRASPKAREEVAAPEAEEATGEKNTLHDPLHRTCKAENSAFGEGLTLMNESELSTEDANGATRSDASDAADDPDAGTKGSEREETDVPIRLPMEERKYIFLSARVHPGESNSSFMMRGAIEFLTSDDSRAQTLRDRFIFKVVPMLNPDGVVVGNHRYNLAGLDLNRQWTAPSESDSPTVFAMQKLLRDAASKTGIALFLDMHGHSRKAGIFLYGCEDKKTFGAPERVFPGLVAATASDKIFFPHECNFKVQKSKGACARVAVWRDYRVASSYTLEASMCGNNARHFVVSDLEEMGRDTVAAIWHFTDPTQHEIQRINRKVKLEFPTRFLTAPETQDDEDDSNESCRRNDEGADTDARDANDGKEHLRQSLGREAKVSGRHRSSRAHTASVQTRASTAKPSPRRVTRRRSRKSQST